MSNTIAACLITAAAIFNLPSREAIANKYDITYPVAELGNCVNEKDCKAYCENPVNFDACSSYAKDKGIQKNRGIEQLNLVSLAKKELACDSLASCQKTCSLEENIPKCSEFGQKHGITTPAIQDGKTKSIIIEKAKDLLGCTSLNSCKSFCDKPENQVQCSRFARTMKIQGGYELAGPGGCNSPESCREYCGKYPEQCKAYYRGTLSVPSCTENMYWDGAVCRQAPTVAEWSSDPKSYCQATAGCSWTGTACQCTQTSDPASVCTATGGCSWTGTTCQCSQQATYTTTDYESVCQQTSGCSWTGTTCNCSSSGGSGGSTSNTSTSTSNSTSGSTSNITGNTTTNATTNQTYNGSCTMPSGGCGTDKYWDSALCQCRSYSSGTNNTPSPTPTMSSGCIQPSGGCGADMWWDPGMCTCKTPTQCTSMSASCTFSSGVCSCISGSGGGSGGGTCTEPSGGCGTNYFWDSANCTCKSVIDQCYQTSGCTWTGTTCQCTQGATTDELKFPVAELGNCSDCGSCRAYCATQENKPACAAYIKSRSAELPEDNAKLLAAAATELGCTTEESCRNFCSDPKNETACRAFSQNHDLVLPASVEPPGFTTDLAGKTLTGSVTLNFSGSQHTTIELSLQSEDNTSDLLFLGRTAVGDDGTATFAWDTKSTGNGAYKLIAKTVKDGVLSRSSDFIKVTVENPGASGQNTIVHAADFTPEAVPVSGNTKIDKIANEPKEEKTTIALSGKTYPDTLVSILIYSNPIVVTVRSDANGVWHYNLEKPLEPGKHLAYAAVTAPDGTKIRSEVASFVVKRAAAAGQNESLELESSYEGTQLAPYLWMAGIITVAGAGLVMLLYRFRRRMGYAADVDSQIPPTPTGS